MALYSSFTIENRPPLLLTPKISRSLNQSATKEFYPHLQITLPNSFEPLAAQFDSFLSTPPAKIPLGQDVSYGPFGTLGITKHPDVIYVKNRLTQLPSTVSLEARAVFLTTLLDKFYPATLGRQHDLSPTYDYGRDRQLAKQVYGGNGLYQAVEEWLALAQGRYPGISERIQLPWIATHIRHTFLRNPHLGNSYNSIQTAIKMLIFLERHFKRHDEDESEYIDRMSEPYWEAHFQLQKHHLLPSPTQPSNLIAFSPRR